MNVHRRLQAAWPDAPATHRATTRTMTLYALVVAAGLALVLLALPEPSGSAVADEANPACLTSPGSDLAPIQCAASAARPAEE